MPSAADVLAQMAADGDHGEADPDQQMEEGDDNYDDEPNLTDDDVLVEQEDEGQEALYQRVGAGRPGRNGPRTPARGDGVEDRGKDRDGGPSTPSSQRSKASTSQPDGNTRHRPRGNLPPAPVFDGDRKKDPKCFNHWVQKVDSYIEIAKKIIDESEIGLRLHAALEGEASDYLEDIPARTFGVDEGWKILMHVLKDKFDERRMRKVGSAMQGFFRMNLKDKSYTLTEIADGQVRQAVPRSWTGPARRDHDLLLLRAQQLFNGTAGQHLAEDWWRVHLEQGQAGRRFAVSSNLRAPAPRQPAVSAGQRKDSARDGHLGGAAQCRHHEHGHRGLALLRGPGRAPCRVRLRGLSPRTSCTRTS